MAAAENQAICWLLLSDSAFALEGYNGAFSLLPVEEQRRASEKSHPRVRRQYVWGRVLTRARLSAELNCAFSDLVFDYGSQGKPYLKWPQQVSDLSFSLTHTDNLIVFGSQPAKHFGIDAERLRPHRDISAIASAVFSHSDCESLSRIPQPHDRMRRFYEIWTLREATLKSCGLSVFSESQGLSFEASVNTICANLAEPFASLFGDRSLSFGTKWIEPDLVLSVARSNDGKLDACENLQIRLESAQDQLTALLDG